MNYSLALFSSFRKFAVKPGARSGLCEMHDHLHARSLSFWLSGCSAHPGDGDLLLCASLSLGCSTPLLCLITVHQ